MDTTLEVCLTASLAANGSPPPPLAGKAWEKEVKPVKAAILLGVALMAGSLEAEAGSGPAAEPAPGAAQVLLESGCEPAAILAELERRLLAAETVSCEFRVTSEGVFQAEFTGLLEVRGRDWFQLSAAGLFGGEGTEVILRAADGEMAFGPAGTPAAAPRPAHLPESVLIGLTRMGILHNLARLTAAAPPDRGEGGVREWVTAGGVRGCGSPADPLQFEVIVAGQPAGTAWLILSETGLPRLRRQVVRFPSGQMTVTERYPLCIAEP